MLKKYVRDESLWHRCTKWHSTKICLVCTWVLRAASFSFKKCYLKVPLPSVFFFFVPDNHTDTLHIFPINGTIPEYVVRTLSKIGLVSHSEQDLGFNEKETFSNHSFLNSQLQILHNYCAISNKKVFGIEFLRSWWFLTCLRNFSPFIELNICYHDQKNCLLCLTLSQIKPIPPSFFNSHSMFKQPLYVQTATLGPLCVQTATLGPLCSNSHSMFSSLEILFVFKLGN